MPEYLTSNISTIFPFTSPGPKDANGRPFSYYVADLSCGIDPDASRVLVSLDLSDLGNCTAVIGTKTLTGGVATVRGPWLFIQWQGAAMVVDAAITAAFQWPLALGLEISPRAVTYEPARVTKLHLRVADDLVYHADEIELQPGFNFAMKTSDRTAVRKTTRLEMAASAGAGAGAWVGCNQLSGVRSISGAPADDAGSIRLKGGNGCYSFLPMTTRAADGSLTVVPGKVLVYNDCQACLSCESIDALYSIAFADVVQHMKESKATICGDVLPRYKALVQYIQSSRSQIEGLKLDVCAAPVPGWFVQLRVALRNSTATDAGPRQVTVTQTGGQTMVPAGRCYKIDNVRNIMSDIALSTLPAALPDLDNVEADSTVTYTLPLYMKEPAAPAVRTAGQTVSFRVDVASASRNLTSNVSCQIIGNYNKD